MLSCGCAGFSLLMVVISKFGWIVLATLGLGFSCCLVVCLFLVLGCLNVWYVDTLVIVLVFS